MGFSQNDIEDMSRVNIGFIFAGKVAIISYNQ